MRWGVGDVDGEEFYITVNGMRSITSKGTDNIIECAAAGNTKDEVWASKNASKNSPEKSMERAQQDSSEKVERNFDSEIRELFRLFDTNNDRSISVQELGKTMRFLGMSPTQQEISDAMRTLDTNGNGRIDFQEFYSFMQAEMSKVSDGDFKHKEEVIRSAFRTFDKDGNGYIDAKELRLAMKKLGECLTDRELDDMMRQADIDGDGKINYEEFVKIWCEAT